jgi:phage terminase large subunit
VPWERGAPVTTAWDLGIGDSTAIWFAQQVGKEVRLIDYYEASGVGLDHYAKMLREKPYSYGEHLLPHDVEHQELSTGRTRKETLEGLGFQCTVVPKLGVDEGIHAARLLLPRCWFDAVKCATGIEALRQYKVDYDERMKVFKKTPRHDWASHAADALRYLAVGLQPPAKKTNLKINFGWVV